MAITTIPWGDGSGDNIYLSAPSQTGDQSVSVTSDPNTGAARSKVVTFSASGVSPVSLTINQAAGTPQEVTVSLHPASYDTIDYRWETASNIDNGYADSNSSNYATINAKQGANEDSWIYYNFDTSSIPVNATILEISCIVKVNTNGNDTNLPTRSVQMYSGTTAKGTSYKPTSSNTPYNLDIGTWNRAELGDARLKLYMKRGTVNTTTTYRFRFYGATLTIKYTI